MKKLKIIFSFYFLLFASACTSIESKQQNTLAPSILDGAWINSGCTCAGKDINSHDQQLAHTLFINGNLVFQDQIVRWKKPEWNRYCSTHQELIITRTAENSFDVNTVSERFFAPGETSCNIFPGKLNRVWKIIAVNKSELKYESTTGCENGPLTCTFKRLDQ